ncbi:hypothetical protein PYW08_006588 [Mythimna loreyi]|uniref:Uncharacterized protein n=1 Tax=Mythimna loreyi TaxID=667449 RepID=A0ACC2QN13_9NEOP|nr:hypothetical protein PYW08_006588 [Mythimna loreyi]
MAVVSEAAATRELIDLFGNAMETAEQAAGQVTGQLSSTFARSADDFDAFPDKSKLAQRNFTLAEVRRCAGQRAGCLYIVYDGQVLDLTQFAPFHLGGASMLEQYAGRDATAAMRAAGMPAQVFDVFLKRFVVGRLVQTATASSSSASTPSRSPAVIQTCGWIPSLMGLCKN